MKRIGIRTRKAIQRMKEISGKGILDLGYLSNQVIPQMADGKDYCSQPLLLSL